MSSGFRDAGFRILATIDNDPWGCQTLRWNFSPATEIIEEDIQNLVLGGQVDVVVGGPPCQSFSRAGRGKINHLAKSGKRTPFIDDRRNRLYRDFVRIVASLQPHFFVMENVPAILSFQNGEIVGEIQEDFERIGYSSEVRKLKAADFGVPQIRRRAIFIGNRVGKKNTFPEPTYANPQTAQQISLTKDGTPLRYRTVSDAISDLPPLQAGQGQDGVPYATSAITDYQKWLRHDSTAIYNHSARGHSLRDIGLFKLLKPGQQMTDLPSELIPYRHDIFEDKIKKQRWDSPSSAIVAHMQKDGLMFIHPDPNQPRSFTPREAARLQSFRDTFRLAGPMNQQFRQIGNAVPPLLARSIAEAIKPALEPVSHPVVTHVLLNPQLVVPL
jgi:DNA (cytosine-5)-methyltransferase 1